MEGSGSPPEGCSADIPVSSPVMVSDYRSVLNKSSLNYVKVARGAVLLYHVVRGVSLSESCS